MIRQNTRGGVPGHKVRGQGQTLSRPRTKDTGASFLQKKNKAFKKNFQAISKKRSSKIFFRRFPLEENKKRSSQIFCEVSGAFQQNFNGSKIVLSPSRGQGNFRGLEATRPRTSKCVLEAKDVLGDSTFAKHTLKLEQKSL